MHIVSDAGGSQPTFFRWIVVAAFHGSRQIEGIPVHEVMNEDRLYAIDANGKDIAMRGVLP
jgi:hypothetical protein